MHSPRVLVGICAYNEERNIGNLLSVLTSDKNMTENNRIMVVCSGCTDQTSQIVGEFQRKDPRIELIIEEERQGKAKALNKIFKKSRETADVLVLVNADAVPRRGSISKLVSELTSSNSGGVFAQPVPVEDSRGICRGIVNVIWRLHHIISLRQNPKLSGELCAINSSCLRDVPERVATDEPYIELSIRRQGRSIRYIPHAVVYIRCPTNIIDLLRQRKRIWIGHMQVQSETGFKVSTSSFTNILRSVSRLNPTEITYMFLGTFLEMIAYFMARIEARKGSIPYAWEPITSTKS